MNQTLAYPPKRHPIYLGAKPMVIKTGQALMGFEEACILNNCKCTMQTKNSCVAPTLGGLECVGNTNTASQLEPASLGIISFRSG